MIGAGQVWQIASAWVDWIAAGLEKNSPRMHDMIDRRMRAFLQRRGDVTVGRPRCPEWQRFGATHGDVRRVRG
jgi:hypothetical protein